MIFLHDIYYVFTLKWNWCHQNYESTTLIGLLCYDHTNKILILYWMLMSKILRILKSWDFIIDSNLYFSFFIFCPGYINQSRETSCGLMNFKEQCYLILTSSEVSLSWQINRWNQEIFVIDDDFDTDSLNLFFFNIFGYKLNICSESEIKHPDNE